MKKIITVLLSVLLIAGLFTGCDGNALAEMVGGGDTPVPTPTPTPEPVEYTVTFNSNGGSEVASQTVKEGECATMPATNPTRDGFDFVNWCSDEALNVEYNFNTPVTSDITLYANWSPVPFKLVAQENGVTVKINKSSPTDAPVISLVYRQTNGTGWTEWTDYTWVSDEGYEIQLNNAEEVEIKAKTTNESFGNSDSEYNHFELTGKVAARGNIMFLLDSTGKSTEVPEYCFLGLFMSCDTLTEAPELPATTLGEHCYEFMFAMTSLTESPVLPATTLAENCYMAMFFGCGTLVKAPALPATTLADACYSGMFQECTALTEAPALPATIMKKDCYDGMFSGCEALTEAPELPATTLAAYCYHEMFAGCSSLITAPELPATITAEKCYWDMFEDCEALTTVPSILPATELTHQCYDGMFNGCSSLTTAPELPATTLADFCYSGMFGGCTKLNSVKVAFTAWNGYCTSLWLSDAGTDSSVTTHTFACPAALQLAGTMSGGSEDTIPDGWTVVNL